MTTADKLLKVAASYIGVKGDHNKFNYWYWVTLTKTYAWDPGTAWCACFASYVANEAGLKCNASASAAGFATQFERIRVQDEDKVQPGDVVVFNWDGRADTGWCDHVGYVEWSTIGQDGRFGTIEGNTGNGAEGKVMRVTRTNWGNYFTAFFRPKYDSASSSSSTAKKSTSSKVLYGIDVSSNQPADIFKKVKADFGIVKMSGNPQRDGNGNPLSWNYVNDYAKQQAADIYKKTGMLGLYHFSWGKEATTEADFFVEQVKKLGYLNKAILALDYEAQATSLGKAWVKKFCDRVKSKAGYSPVIYASGSVITSQGLKDLGYPIWCANYYKGYEDVSGYSTAGMKIWPGLEDSVLWQFTSSGYLSGYSKPLDMDEFRGDKAKWQELAGTKAKAPAEKKEESKKESSKPAAKKTVTQIANEVLAGKWGNGEDRKKKLTAAGYSYKQVQAKVNEILEEREIEQAAKDVIVGKYGNGQARISALKKAGYDPDKVQKKVNELLE
jgi:GH25 family lysozyme M1 (1,4-beta-N-acetylmuramidase)